jgi:hypothetical protein
MVEKKLTKVVITKPFPWHSKAYKTGDIVDVEDAVAKLFIGGQLAITPEEAEKRAAAKRARETQTNSGKVDESVRRTLGRHQRGPGNTEPYKRRDMQVEGTQGSKSED